MNQTLYIGEEDLATWREARRYCAYYGLSLSQFVTAAVRERLTGLQVAGNGPKGAVETHRHVKAVTAGKAEKK